MAIVLLTVAMPLTFFVSCFREKNEIVEIVFDPQTSYTLKETNVNTLISDSGITQYKILAATWLMFGKASEPYQFFPDGIYLEKFDTLFNVEAIIKADTAYYYERRKLWELNGNVDMSNLDGVRFQTAQIFMNQQEEVFPFYSDAFFLITEGESSRSGYGFKANRNMSSYRLFHQSAVLPLESKPRTTNPASDTSYLPAVMSPVLTLQETQSGHSENSD